VHPVDRFAMVDGSYQHTLLRDAQRTAAYARAIAEVVREGDVVADLGSGSGVLAFLALRAGAARVHAVEANRPTLRNLETLVGSNQLRGRVFPAFDEAEKWQPPEPIDVVLCELMETGLLHEDMDAAMRNVHGWEHKPRGIVPRGARLLAEAVELSDTFEGYRAPLAGFRAEGSGEALSDAACYTEFDFLARAPPEGVDARFPHTAPRAGRVDAMRLRTPTLVGPDLWLEPSPGHCTPVVLPLPEPFDVRAFQRLEGALRYRFQFSSEPVEFELSAA
jgi:predicted RNA methylase